MCAGDGASASTPQQQTALQLAAPMSTWWQTALKHMKHVAAADAKEKAAERKVAEEAAAKAKAEAEAAKKAGEAEEAARKEQEAAEREEQGLPPLEEISSDDDEPKKKKKKKTKVRACQNKYMR